MNAAANLSKALWGQANSRIKERQALRESIGIADDSPFHTVTMRNNFEHFDERLERWWRESATHSYIDFNIMPKAAIEMPGLKDVDWFRNLDPASGILYFWGQEFNVRELIKEAQRVLPKMKEEAGKPRLPIALPAQAATATGTAPDAATDKPE